MKTLVACYNDKGTLVGIYKSAKEASTQYGLHPRTIDRVIRGDIKTAKGLYWRRFDSNHIPSEIEINNQTQSKIKTTIPVAKLDDNGQILEVYPSISNAAKSNHLDAHSLRDRLNKKYPYSGKAKYRYLDNNEIIKYGLKQGHQIVRINTPIMQYSLSGQYIATYPSIQSALKVLHKSPRSQMIALAIKNKYQSAYGYKWRYK